MFNMVLIFAHNPGLRTFFRNFCKQVNFRKQVKFAHNLIFL